MSLMEKHISLSSLCKRTQNEIDRMCHESHALQDALHDALSGRSLTDNSVIVTLQSLDEIHQKLIGLSQTLEILTTKTEHMPCLAISPLEIRDAILLESLADRLCAASDPETISQQCSEVTMF